MPSFEKSIKGATKPKNAAPKSKYIEHILLATRTDAGIAEIFRFLSIRLRESTWTIVFKALIVSHMIIREGPCGSALGYLSQNPRLLTVSSITDIQTQGGNIGRYSEYLIARALAFGETETDYVREGQGRLKRLTVEKGLLRETEIVQKQIRALLKCDLLSDEPENEITLTAFRLLTLDLLNLYSVMNEGTINVLEHYFEMSRPDSERALRLYKVFSELTEEVVQFLRIARQYEHATRLEIPNLKHASTDLAKLLEDDLKDPDFTTRRKEYRAQKYGTKSTEEPSKSSANKQPSKPAPTTAPSQPPSIPAVKSEAPDLIDFFGSIEQNQQPMNQPTPAQQFPMQNPQVQQFQSTGFQQQQTGFGPQQNPGFQQTVPTGFVQQQSGFVGGPGAQSTNPFGQYNPQQQPIQQPVQQPAQQLHPQNTGAGFGGYTPQPQTNNFQSSLGSIPQNGVASFQQPMQTGTQRGNNPFRQSMLIQNNSTPQFDSARPTSPLARQNTNPFAKHQTQQPPSFAGNPSPFSSASPPPPPQQEPPQQLQPLQQQRTGTNPFARSASVPAQQLQVPSAAPLRPNPTGSTNPFRQSAFISQQTGQGWQAGVPQGTMGGLQVDNLETIPVFPRPGQTT